MQTRVRGLKSARGNEMRNVENDDSSHSRLILCQDDMARYCGNGNGNGICSCTKELFAKK